LNEATALLRAFRLVRLALAMIRRRRVALCLFPLCRDATRLRLKTGVGRGIIHALGVRLDVDLTHAVPGALIVANHVSWIDIFVINAVLPAACVPKEEVRRWPLVGLLAARSETVFLRRGSRGHARIINQQVADILGKGNHVAVFPEGTTTDGTPLPPSQPALIQPALVIGRPVLPLAISYWEADGSRSLAPAYVGDVSLAQCLRAIIGRRGLVARVAACPALGLHGEDRRQVAALAREAICAGARIDRPT